MLTPKPDHQPFYCEENVWLLLEHPALVSRAQRWAMIITNEARCCPMWQQRAGEPGQAVLWDYHVIALTRDEPEGWLAWDLDHRPGLPCALSLWLERSFPLRQQLPQAYQPMFRVMSGEVYRGSLRTDRSHMRDERGGWLKPPPPWAPPGQPSERATQAQLPPSTLMAWLTLKDRSQPGQVYDWAALSRWLDQAP